METTIYLRIAKGSRSRISPPKVKATIKPTQEPLTDGRGRILPTTMFGIKLDIPDAAFESAARVVAELKVPEERLEIAAEVVELAQEES